MCASPRAPPPSSTSPTLGFSGGGVAGCEYGAKTGCAASCACIVEQSKRAEKVTNAHERRHTIARDFGHSDQIFFIFNLPVTWGNTDYNPSCRGHIGLFAWENDSRYQ